MRKVFAAVSSIALVACNNGPTVDTKPAENAKGGGGIGKGVVGPEGVAAFDALAPAEKERIKGAKVFFGHQSVGQNTIEGAAALGFKFEEVKGATDYSGPKLGHAFLDKNREPLQKIQGFDQMVGKIGSADVAGMKLCWIDFDTKSDVARVQNAYVSTINKVVDQNPKTHLFHVTPPLTTDDPKLNKARVAYGEWMKNTYADKAVVFDLGAVISTKEGGSACEAGGARKLCDEWASDEGHLNDKGKERAAKALLYAIYRSL
jgi:hypothetical protein